MSSKISDDLDAHGKEDMFPQEIEHVGREPSFYTPQEEKALVRKIDLVLMPMMWLMYLLSYLDRTKYVLFRWHSTLAVD